MSKEQDLASLGKTAKLLPAQEAGAITALAARAPEVAEHLHQKLISELGSQAVAKDQPEKAAEMKGYGNNRGSIGEQLAAVIKKENKSDLSADERGKLADAVAAASGMDKAQVFAKLQAAAMAPAGADATYKELQEKIDTKMGAAIAKTAAAKPQEVHFRYEDFRQNGDSGKTYTPPALDEQLKKELTAALDVKYMGRGLSDKQKAAVMTIAENSPEHAGKILKAAKALGENPLSGDNRKAMTKAIEDAAIDSTIRSGGNNAKVVDALVELAPQLGKEANRDNLDKWLKGAAAAKVASDKRDAEIAGMAADDPRRLELERQRDEAKKAQEKNSNSIGDLLSQPGGMLMLFVGLILSALTGKDMISAMLGGGKDEAPAAGTPAPAAADKDKVRIFNAKGDAPSRTEGNDIHLSKADQAKLAAYTKKQGLADDGKSLGALVDSLKKDAGGKAPSAADLLKAIQSIDAEGNYKGPQAAAPAVAAPAPAVAAPAPAVAAPAPAVAGAAAGAAVAGGASYLTKVKVQGVNGVTEIDAETLQKAMRAAGKDTGKHGVDGVDGKAGRDTAAALAAYRDETGKHKGDRSLTIYADEYKAIMELAAKYKAPEQAAGQGRAPAIKLGESGRETSTAITYKGADQTYAIAPELAGKVKPEVLDKVVRAAGGVKDPSKPIDLKEFERLSKVVMDQSELHVRGGGKTGISIDRHADSVLEQSAKAAEAEVIVALKARAGKTDALLDKGVRALFGLSYEDGQSIAQFQKEKGLEVTGAPNKATMAAFAQEAKAAGATLSRDLAIATGVDAASITPPMVTPKDVVVAQAAARK